MGEVKATLTVPAKWVRHVRKAVVTEIEIQRDYIADDRAATERFIATGEGTFQLDDAVMLIERDAALVPQLTGSGDAELEGAADTLAHICEAMARELVCDLQGDVAAPESITAVLNSSPIDEDAAAQIRDVLDPLTWAVGEAARLHGEFARAARKTAVAV